MNRYERILVWLLRFGGAVMLTALGAVVMPFDWMNSIHRHAGLGELPHAPIVGYLTRSISGFCALHGALLVFLAGDVRRYLPLGRFLAVAGAVFGAMMLAIDCAVGMPLPWTVCEGPWRMVRAVMPPMSAAAVVLSRISGGHVFELILFPDEGFEFGITDEDALAELVERQALRVVRPERVGADIHGQLALAKPEESKSADVLVVLDFGFHSW